MDGGAFDLASLGKAMPAERFALKLSQDWIPEDYDERVDESILNIKFRPDVFQKQSFYFLSKNQPVFVSAHTSSGKTLVAEYAIFRAQKNGTRVIYTSPIKALSNQKFYDFKQKFDDVGLITGDVQVNPDAQCIIMTTEILRNLVYKNSDLLRDTEYVIFDEVHYINDTDRGVVWEESIIMTPRHISLVLLSATIPNAMEFGEWVGRTKRQCVFVISTGKRAVPLEFAIYCDSDAYELCDGKRDKRPASNFPGALVPFSSKIKMKRRFRISDLGNYVANRRLIPAIFFSFSKRACEEYGRTLQLLDLTGPAEKKKISLFLEQAMGALGEEDRFLPQILVMREQALRGVAIHHGGLLPFVKECVELLFSQNLIKILVATETFAMGVNMPAKCCVFLSVTKIENGSFRFLSSGEFIQMSGRAGRRGMDRVGTVLIADQRMHPIEAVRKMVYGTPYNLSSRFKLSFSLILMASRSNIEVEDLMRSSFREHGSQRDFSGDMQRLARLETRRPFSCDSCADLPAFLESLSFICRENCHLLKRAVGAGDLLVLKNNSIVSVEQVRGNRLAVRGTDRVLDGRLFCKRGREDGGTDTSKYCRYPPDEVHPGGDTEIQHSDVFAVVKNNRVCFDYGLTDIQFVTPVMDLKKAYSVLEDSACLGCADFSRHYYEAIEAAAVENEARYIRNKYDKKSLIQISEFSARTRFLVRHHFIEESIALKGRVAAEIRTVNEILVTEMIFSNRLRDFTPSELIAVFSAMVHESHEEREFEIADHLRDKVQIVSELHERLSGEMAELEIPAMEPLNFEMVNAVFDWCQGLSLGVIVARHSVQEGTFVRLILRLEECSREMVAVSSLIGDGALGEKFAEASKKIKRDIVFMPSLYI